MNTDERHEKEFFITKAESLLAQGFYQEAQDFALNWLDRFPGDAESRAVLCQAWTRLGKLDKVKQLLQEVDEEILGMSLIYARMGDICQRSGLNREAVAFYKKFVALNPHAALAKEVGEKITVLVSASKERSEPSEEPEEPRPKMPVLQTVTMAELYLKQGHREMAREILEGIVKKDQTNQRALVLLRQISDNGDTVGAEKKIWHRQEAVIGELNRWLQNIGRMRPHAA